MVFNVDFIPVAVFYLHYYLILPNSFFFSKNSFLSISSVSQMSQFLTTYWEHQVCMCVSACVHVCWGQGIIKRWSLSLNIYDNSLFLFSCYFFHLFLSSFNMHGVPTVWQTHCHTLQAPRCYYGFILFMSCGIKRALSIPRFC